MRLSLTLVDGRSERAVDTVVDFDPDQPVADLVRPLVGVLGEEMHDSFARRIPVWVDGAEVDPLAPAGKSGIRSGAVVSLFEPADRVVRAAPSGVAELRVVAGPGAGRIHRLPLGETVVGCGAPGWSLPDLRLPADGLRVTVTPDGSVRVVPAPGLEARLDSRPLGEQPAPEQEPTRAERRVRKERDRAAERLRAEQGVDPVADPAPERARAGAAEGPDDGAWPVGGYLAAGDTVLARAQVGEPTADVSVNHDEALVELNRPPRLLPPDRERSFHLPDRPAPRKGRPLPWVMVVAPLVISVPMAFISPRFLLFALFSPIMAIANFLSDRRGSRKENIAANVAYEQTLAAVGARIERALVAEQQERRLSSPDPATLLMAAIGPGPRLWERRPSDPDYLRLRVGLATLPATVRVEQRRDKTDEAAPPRTLEHVPAWMDLSRLGVIGVAGDEDTARPLARWLVAQAALLHSPRDVRVVVLSDAAGEPDWDWVRWLPHARTEGDVNPLLGTQQESVGRRLAELSAVVEAREQAATDRVRPTPDVVVVLDGARRLRALPAVVDLLRRGPAVGVHVVCVDREVRQLPEECRAVVACEGGAVRLSETASDGTDGIVPDLVEGPWCETVARGVSALRDTTPQDEAAGIPGSARLLEQIDLDPPTPEAVAVRWEHGRTTDVVVGVGYDGPFHLDLRRDGPHALVAGTTGSGKSEFLQTLVASLAVANRPDQLTFVLVDYKGGSAFKDCARLPHTVGMVTDLDNHLVSRALVSLGAELRRREHLLAGPGAKDLEDYWAVQRSRPELPAIPRLVLVIDEFASLVAELPDFVQGLVGIAQRGRSLGIHLVLATQRPSGVVSADIRANTNLRVSLRVTDDNDSRDVLDAPDAARILPSQPGRAYVRSGASTLMPFQSGRVGGRRPEAETGDRPAAEALAWPVPWSRAGLPAPVRPRSLVEQTDEADTDLAAVVDAVTSLNDTLGVPPQHRPWLDALPGRGRPRPAARGRRPGPGRGCGPAARGRLGGGGPAGAPGAAREDLPARPRRPPLRPGRTPLGPLDHPAHPRRRAGRRGRGPRPAHPRARLRQRGAARARPAAARRGGGLPHPGRPRRPAAEPAGVPGRGAAGAAGPGWVRRPGRAPGLAARRRAAAVRADADRPLGRLPLHAGGGRRWGDDRPGDGAAARRHRGRCARRGQRRPPAGARPDVHPRGEPAGAAAGRPHRLQHRRHPDPGGARPPARGAGADPRPDPRAPGRGALLPTPPAPGRTPHCARSRSGAASGTRPPPRTCGRSGSRRCPSSRRTTTGCGPWSRRRGRRSRTASSRSGSAATTSAWSAWTCPAARWRSSRGRRSPARPGCCASWCGRQHAAGVPVLGLCVSDTALSADLADLDALVRAGDTDEEALVERLRGLGEGAVVVVDDADALKESPLSPALLAMVQQARGKRWRVVLAGTVAELGTGYSGWTYEARKSRQGLLLSPQAMGDGDLYSVRLMRSALMPRVHPGRGLVVDAGGGQRPCRCRPATAADGLLPTRPGSETSPRRGPTGPRHDQSGVPG